MIHIWIYFCSVCVGGSLFLRVQVSHHVTWIAATEEVGVGTKDPKNMKRHLARELRARTRMGFSYNSPVDRGCYMDNSRLFMSFTVTFDTITDTNPLIFLQEVEALNS